MKLYISLTPDNYNAKVADLCPNFAARYNTVVKLYDEEGNETSEQSLTFAELVETTKSGRVAHRAFKWTELEEETYQSDVTQLNEETGELEVVGQETLTRMVPVTTTSVDPEGNTVTTENTYSLHLIEIPSISFLNGEHNEFKNLGTGQSKPFNTIMSMQEAMELLNSENVTRNA